MTPTPDRLDLLESALDAYAPGHDFTAADFRAVVAALGFAPTLDEWGDIGFDLDEIPAEAIDYQGLA